MASSGKKKGIGGFMKRAAAKGPAITPTTEAELRAKDTISAEDVMGLSVPTEEFLCKPSDNIYHIDFTAFKLRDMESNTTLFEVAKPDDMPVSLDDGDDTARFIRYDFPPQFLSLKTVGATVTFKVGAHEPPVQSFKMIERHYFKDKLLRSFEFDFGFCIPSSTNTVEHVYDLPALNEQDVEDMVAAPYATKSDSFYIINGKLMLHNKAEYAYNAGL